MGEQDLTPGMGTDEGGQAENTEAEVSNPVSDLLSRVSRNIDSALNAPEPPRDLDLDSGFLSWRRRGLQERTNDLLRAEGMSEQETIGLDEEQVDALATHMVLRLTTRYNGDHTNRAGELLEPDVISARLTVADPRNTGMLDRGSAFDAGIAGKTFRGGSDPVTTVTVRYSLSEDDDRIFSDQYRIGEDGHLDEIDVDRYESRRTFPEIADILKQISTGDTEGALHSLSLVREGRRDFVFRRFDDVLHYASNKEQVERVFNFLLGGIQAGQFAPTELFRQLRWHPSNQNRSVNDARYAFFREMPQYDEALKIIKDASIPSEEGAENVQGEALTSLIWVLGENALSNDEVQRLTSSIPHLLFRSEMSRSIGDPGHIRMGDVLESLPHLVRNPEQRRMVVEALKEARNNPRMAREADYILTHMESERLLNSLDQDESSEQ